MGAITKDSEITEFDLPHPASALVGIVAHNNGAAFVEIMGNRIGFVDYNGEISEYEFRISDAKPHAITIAPDGTFWVSLWGAGKLAHVTLDGQTTKYEIPVLNAEPHGAYIDIHGVDAIQ